MQRPKRAYPKYKMVSIPNPNYKKQLISYREFLKRESKRIAKKLGSLRTQIKKIDKELDNATG